MRNMTQRKKDQEQNPSKRRCVVKKSHVGCAKDPDEFYFVRIWVCASLRSAYVAVVDHFRNLPVSMQFRVLLTQLCKGRR